jgi:hypothetical protein
MPPVVVTVLGTGRGRVVKHVQTNGTASVTQESAVFASVTEVDHQNYQHPYVGAARMYICNVAPGAGFVDVWVHVDFDQDLPFRVTLLIIN